MLKENDYKTFVLYLKLKNQKIENVEDSKKYSMIKEIALQEGDNMIGSDICKCNIYLPFEEMPEVMGKISLRDEKSIKTFTLTDFGKSDKFFFSKSKGKRFASNKETPFKPHQKLHIGNLVEMNVQIIIEDEAESMCFEEEVDKEEKQEGWDLQESEGEQEETELGKRNGDHLGKVEDSQTIKEIAEDKEILQKVANPFNENEVKKVENNKLNTPKKKRGRKKVKTEEKTNLKIINYFKIIDKKSANEVNTTAKKIVEETKENVPDSIPQKKLFTKKIEKKTEQKKTESKKTKSKKAETTKESVPDHTKFTKPALFMNILGIDNHLENNLGMIRDSLQNNNPKYPISLNKYKLKNQVLNILLKKADIIQNNPKEESKEMVRDLKKLSTLKWWVCFSNVNQSKRHEELVNTLKTISNIHICEDFEKFVNEGNEDPQIQKVLVMKKYKRTYKLIVAMNKNILPLNYDWILDVSKNKNIFSNPCDYFISFPQNGKILPGYNKSNIVGWFKHHSHKFKVDLEQSYLMRKQSPFGFLENHNIIIYDKCFRGIRLENLNINRGTPGAPVKTKTRGIRSSKKENDNDYIMRRIVETADGKVNIINDFANVKNTHVDNMVNVLVVDNFNYSELENLQKEHKRLKIYSKESFLNSFMKQYLHSNERYIIKKETLKAE